MWVANRVHLVTEMFDWMFDPDRMPGGHAYLNDATYSRAVTLLVQAAASLLRTKKTTRDHIGSPACWAILLAQQAHYLVHGWEMSDDACKRWNVQAMHRALVSAQGQRLNREGGSSSTAQTSTPRGLNQRRAAGAHPPCPLSSMQAPSANPTPFTQVVDKGDSPHALAIRVDPLGNNDDLKAKVVPLCHHPLLLMHDLAPLPPQAKFLHYLIGTGLHHPILELEQPARSAPTGTMVSGIAKLKQSKGLRWGKSSKQAQQAQEVIPEEPASKKAAIEELRRSHNAGRAASPPPPPSSHPGPLSPLSSVDTHGAFSDPIECLFTALAAKRDSREFVPVAVPLLYDLITLSDQRAFT